MSIPGKPSDFKMMICAACNIFCWRIPNPATLFQVRGACENAGLLSSIAAKAAARVCYVDFEEQQIVYLLAVFAKNEQENLSKSERNALKKKIDQLEKCL